jgi:PAS domain S-box-containing protein
MPALVFACDTASRNDYTNHAYQAYTGLSAESLLGDRWIEIVHPDDRAGAAGRWDEAARAGNAYEFENRLRRADGSYRWFIGRAAPLRDRAGAVTRWLGACIDIHDRRMSEAALAESEERHRLLAAHASDMIARANLEGVCHYVSPGAYEITGYGPEELVGTSSLEFSHPDDAAMIASKFATLARGDLDHATLSYRLRRKNGTWAPVEAKVRLARSATGEPEALVSVTRDISDRQQLEAQLRQAQKMEAMGALTGGVAHDFNNLLTVILGNSEILAEDVEDPAQRSLARVIQNAAETGADLTQRLLAFARRQSLELEPVKVDEVLGGMIGLLRRTIGEHIELRTEFRGAGTTLVDKSLLESALLNLVVNAKDAMPQEGTLTIATGEGVAGPRDGNLPASQPVVFITIADTGTGMPPEVIERVFEPFFTTKEIGKGTGLGLSMVYGFAQQSGGHVRIDSKPGQGTVVTILLRAVAAAPARTGSAPVPEPVRRGQGRVLLVEDAPSVRVFIRTQLQGLGYEVTDVGDGPSALQLLRMGAPFDLLLTDVVLPKGMSGVEIAREAQALIPSLKVLRTSGYSEEVFQTHGRPKGDTPLLRKPFRRRELSEAVRQALR